MTRSKFEQQVQTPIMDAIHRFQRRPLCVLCAFVVQDKAKQNKTNQISSRKPSE
jgi:hypothetical protein